MVHDDYLPQHCPANEVAAIAATVFAALIQKIDLYPANEDELIERSVAIAVKLAARSERRVSTPG